MPEQPNDDIENHDTLMPILPSAGTLPAKWVIERDGSSIVEIEMLASTSIQLGEGLPPDLFPQLHAVIDKMPGLIRNAHDLSTRTYKLTFSPSVTQALQSGTAEIVTTAEGGYRALARDTVSGRFVEAGTLNFASNPAKWASLAWEFFAVITAQRYLSEINHRLSGIRNDINALRELGQDREYGEIKAVYQRLTEVT